MVTQWTNAKITRKTHTTFGGNPAVIYTIAGISGDNGGTLTTKLSNVELALVHVYAAATGVACTWYVSGKQVIAAYTNPAAAHTIKILVVQG